MPLSNPVRRAKRKRHWFARHPLQLLMLPGLCLIRHRRHDHKGTVYELHPDEAQLMSTGCQCRM